MTGKLALWAAEADRKAFNFYLVVKHLQTSLLSVGRIL